MKYIDRPYVFQNSFVISMKYFISIVMFYTHAYQQQVGYTNLSLQSAPPNSLTIMIKTTN